MFSKKRSLFSRKQKKLK